VPDYVGINHLGWLRALRRDGEDLLPGLLGSDAAIESFEEGRLFGAPLLRALAAMPNEYLHFYYSTAEVLAALAEGPTRGEYLLAEQQDFYAAAAARPAEAEALWEATRRRREESYLAEARAERPRDEQDLAGGGYEEVALDLMQALSGGRPRRLIVNVANGDTLPELPPDLVLEVPCQVDQGGARPLPVAALNLHQLGLIASVRAAERAAIEAVSTGSDQAALRAFALSPLVNSAAIARRLLDDLLRTDSTLARLLG
jgi:6-phospho-beta-glucosidase